MLLYNFDEPIVEPFGVERKRRRFANDKKMLYCSQHNFPTLFWMGYFSNCLSDFPYFLKFAFKRAVLVMFAGVFFSRQFNFKVETRLKWFQSEIIISSYRISSYNFRRIYSRPETVWGNTVCTMYIRGVKSLVSRYIEGYSFWSIWEQLRQPTGQTQDDFNFGPSLLKF